MSVILDAYFLLLGGPRPESELPNSSTIEPTTQAGIPLVSGGSGLVPPVFAALNLAGGSSILAGVLPATFGGTGNSSINLTAGGIIYADGTKLESTGPGVPNSVLMSPTTGNVPVWKVPVDIITYSLFGGV